MSVSVEVTTSVSGINVCLDDIRDEEVVEILEENGIDGFLVDLEDIDVDVDLDEFDNDDLIEELEDAGYEVFEKESHVHPFVYNSGYDISRNHIEQVKDLLQKHCYDSSFLKFMLSEIAEMPMTSSVDAVLEKLKTMCE